MKIKLSDHFTYKKLLRFVFTSVIMMVFTSIYGVVDGLFISNFVGKTPFASINLIMPFIMILGGIGFMVGTGGSAIVAKTLGEGDRDRANRYFTMIIYLTIALGIIFSTLGIVFIRPIARFLGATDAMLEGCVSYGRTMLIFNTAFMLQSVFHSFCVTAEKPKLGLIATVSAGVTNMALDALFVVGFGWGTTGAAVATGLSECVGAFVPMIYFLRKNSSLLRLRKTNIEIKPLVKACTNGSSELMSSISGSIIGMLYNAQLLKFAGENGVAAYGVLMYVQFVFIAVFIGYSVGSAPVIGYHYGAENRSEMKNMLKKSYVLMFAAGVVMMLLAQVLASTLAKIFVGYDAELFELTKRAFRIFSFAFVLSGLNIFSSSFFTALGNGAVSAAISFLRTLVFQMLCVLLLPVIFGIDGIWFAISVAEICAFVLSVMFLQVNRKKYGY